MLSGIGPHLLSLDLYCIICVNATITRIFVRILFGNFPMHCEVC